MRRVVIRDYENIHRHPIPIYALVFWADTGVVDAFLPLWRYWDEEDERYATLMPKGTHITGKEAHTYVRVFNTPEDAVKFFGNENASCPDALDG